MAEQEDRPAGGLEEDGLITLVLEAQAEERERVARELHDETGQSLTALLVGLRALESTVTGEAQQRVARLRNDVRDLIENVGRLARGLHPPALGELSLAAVIEQQVSDFAEASGIQSEVDIEEPELLDQLARPAALAVYRIVQEGLTNVWRHSGAKHVMVRLQPVGGGIRVEVSDDGNGLAHREPEGRGLGIRLLTRRVESLGGRLTVDAAVGKGTTLRAELPLPGASK
ncbi:MAG: sensor histidine kinase [Myxococcales bacterium]|nr:sensor histidine kinase [Myxococcales bacterium]